MELDRARKFPHSIENEGNKNKEQSPPVLCLRTVDHPFQRVPPFFPSLCFYHEKINSFILQFVFGQVTTHRHWIQRQNLSTWIVAIMKQFNKKTILHAIFFAIYWLRIFNLIFHRSDQLVFLFFAFELLLFFFFLIIFERFVVIIRNYNFFFICSDLYRFKYLIVFEIKWDFIRMRFKRFIVE